MTRLREKLTLLLIGLLPFHALLVTVGTKLLKGSGQAPWGVLAIWKEALLAVILLLALVEIQAQCSKSKTKWKKIFECDVLDAVILLIALLAVSVSLLTHTSLQSFLLGLRYDVLPLFAFLILRRVPWSHHFVKTAGNVLVLFGSIVAALAIIGLLLPLQFYTALGYSDMHSLYDASGPLAPYQMIGESVLRRAQGPMSGPNQLGLWLLLPWSLALLEAFRSLRAKSRDLASALLAVTFIGVAILASFSRSAWLAAIVIAALAFILIFPRRMVKSVFLGSAFTLVLLLFAVTVLSPQVILRSTSTQGHLSRPLLAWESMWNKPWGQGLGTAGPASNHTSDACVELAVGSDASWAASHPDLCVFVGDSQVQPSNRICHCPFLPENWYLQFGIEMGVTGFVLSLLLPILVVGSLWTLRKKLPGGVAHLAAGTGLAFIGVSLAGLLLHSWEDTAIAFSVWVLLASVLPASHSNSKTMSQ